MKQSVVVTKNVNNQGAIELLGKALSNHSKELSDKFLNTKK